MSDMSSDTDSDTDSPKLVRTNAINTTTSTHLPVGELVYSGPSTYKNYEEYKNICPIVYSGHRSTEVMVDEGNLKHKKFVSPSDFITLLISKFHETLVVNNALLECFISRIKSIFDSYNFSQPIEIIKDQIKFAYEFCLTEQSHTTAAERLTIPIPYGDFSPFDKKNTNDVILENHFVGDETNSNEYRVNYRGEHGLCGLCFIKDTIADPNDIFEDPIKKSEFLRRLNEMYNEAIGDESKPKIQQEIGDKTYLFVSIYELINSDNRTLYPLVYLGKDVSGQLNFKVAYNAGSNIFSDEVYKLMLEIETGHRRDEDYVSNSLSIFLKKIDGVKLSKKGKINKSKNYEYMIEYCSSYELALFLRSISTNSSSIPFITTIACDALIHPRIDYNSQITSSFKKKERDQLNFILASSIADFVLLELSEDEKDIFEKYRIDKKEIENIIKQPSKELAIGQLMNLLQRHSNKLNKKHIIRFINELEKLKEKYTNKEGRRLTVIRIREKKIPLKDYSPSFELEVLRPFKHTNKKNTLERGGSKSKKRKTQKNRKKKTNKKRKLRKFSYIYNYK